MSEAVGITPASWTLGRRCGSRGLTQGPGAQEHPEASAWRSRSFTSVPICTMVREQLWGSYYFWSSANGLDDIRGRSCTWASRGRGSLPPGCPPVGWGWALSLCGFFICLVRTSLT